MNFIYNLYNKYSNSILAILLVLSVVYPIHTHELNVPFVSQRSSGYYPSITCGTASTLMVLKWYKQQNPSSPHVIPSYKELTDELQIPAHGGASQATVENWLRAHNWTYTSSFQTLDALKNGLHNGPIAICLAKSEYSKKRDNAHNALAAYWNSIKPHAWPDRGSWGPSLHFIVLIGYNENGFTYYDPEDTSAYSRTLSYDEFTYRWLPDQSAWQLRV